MKISLRWLCDHIHGLAWNLVDIQKLIALFNAKVAEIEHVEKVHVPVAGYEAVRVSRVNNEQIFVVMANGRTATLPQRSDCVARGGDDAFLITSQGDGYRWVTLRDVSLEKDGLLPALKISQDQLSGGWKTLWEEEDYILDVDNKSLTHRPDMWGHRGFAREVGALFGKKLVNNESLITPITIVETADTHIIHNQIALRNEQSALCNGFAAIKIDTVVHAASDVRCVSRLVKIGYRPRSAAVDMTNYAMADWGHPMHAYDQARVCGSVLAVRCAQPEETLTILDGSSLKLDPADIVITDAEKIIGLAGIMGGASDSVSLTTTGLILEAGNFHASTIRRSAARHKLRTESSQRFEKTLDNQQLPFVLQRCIALGYSWGVITQPLQHSIVVVRPAYVPRVLTVSHAYIINRIGAVLTPSLVAQLLESIDFSLTYAQVGDDTLHTIVVPSYRATKDISGMHDIVEEVARLYGFDNIVPVLPSVMQHASNVQPVMRERMIKNYLVQAAGMQEQRNYAFYNEQLLTQLGWHEDDYLFLQNPVSQEARRLIGSLLPHLFGNVMDNMADVDQCAFFEWGTVWPSPQRGEQKEVAGVWYKKRGSFNFYELKEVVNRMCHLAGVTLEWEPAALPSAYQWLVSPGAVLCYNGNIVGAYGAVHPVIMQKMGGLPESSMYAFVVDATLLQNNPAPRYTVSGMRRYQHSTIDLSVMVPQTTRVAVLEAALRESSELIEQVKLIDFFEKKEWADTRSVAFRLMISHPERTLTREEIELVRTSAITCLASYGAQLRE